MDVFFRNVPVLAVTGFFGCPVQKREVQKAVDDQAVVFRGIHSTPGLDEFSFFMETADELVCGLDRRFSSCPVSREFPGRHAGRGV